MSNKNLKDSPDYSPETEDREEPTGCLDQIDCIVLAIVSGKELKKQLKELK